MASYTSFLNLEKPTTSERLDVLKINSNWDKIDAGVSALNNQIGADTKWLSVPASGSTTATMSSRGLWLFYRVYRPTIVFIRTNGTVELVVGESQDLTFSLSGSTLTITNPATWAINCWALG